MRKGILNFDGSCWPKNPGGHAGWGFVLQVIGDDPTKSVTHPHCGYVGFGEGMTNNVAEYWGLLQGIKLAVEEGVEDLDVYGDSQLVINQLRGEYSVKAPLIFPLFKAVLKLSKPLKAITPQWIRREINQKTDDLSKWGVLLGLETDCYFFILRDGTSTSYIVRKGVVTDSEGSLNGTPVGRLMDVLNRSGIKWEISETPF